MEGLEWFWLNSIVIILALSFINKYKERKGDVSSCTSVATDSATAVTKEDAPYVTGDYDDANTDAAVQPWDSGGGHAKLNAEDHTGDLVEIKRQEQRIQNAVCAIEKVELSFLNLREDKSQKEVSGVEIEELSLLNLTEGQSKEEFSAVAKSEINSQNLTEGQSQREVNVVERAEVSSLNLTEVQSHKESSDVEKEEIRSQNLIEGQLQKEVSAVEKAEISSMNLTGNQSQNITRTCDIVDIFSLRKILTNSNTEVWTFIEIKNQIYSSQITMTQGNILIKSLSKRIPPANAERLQYQNIKKLINRNNITTFLEINPGQRDNSDGSSIFIHIQLKGDEGRTKQYELMCTGEEDGVSYARTTFLEIESSPLAAIWGGDRNDGHHGAIRGFTTGGEIIKTVVPGLVAGSPQRKPTHFVIYTQENNDYKEKYTIGKVVYGLNNFHSLYEQASLHGHKSININDCGIVLAGTQLKSIPSPITIDYLKDMVTQSTSGVWAVLKMKDQDYSAQLVNIKGYLLLKSLYKRSLIPNASTIPYQEVRNLVNRDNITIFLEIKLSEKENSNSDSKFIHIKLFGSQGRHKQFEAMCMGEVNGISYAKTDFLGILGFPAQGLWAGARNDELDTELPGFTRGESGRAYITPGLVAGFYEGTSGRKPTHFLIYTEEANHDYQETSSIGKVVLGLNDVHMLYAYAKMNGSAYIKIEDCGIVLD